MFGKGERGQFPIKPLKIRAKLHIPDTSGTPGLIIRNAGVVSSSLTGGTTFLQSEGTNHQKGGWPSDKA